MKLFRPCLPLFLLLTASLRAAEAPPAYEAAAKYLESCKGDAMLVYLDGKLVFERYLNGYTAGGLREPPARRGGGGAGGRAADPG